MTSDDATKQQPPSMVGIGSGHICAFRCASCAGVFGSAYGSGIRRVLGVRQKVCPSCKANIDKGRT